VENAAGGPARFQIIVVLACVLALDAAEKATVSAAAGSLKHVFSIGTTDLGLLIAASSLTGALFTLPIGSFVDRVNRRRVLMIAVALWTVAMVVSGTATSFIYLLVTRMFLGGVTAAASPTVASLTGDYFPGRDRAAVYGLILAGELVGTGAGFFFSGEISSLIDWRWSFYLMAIPSLVVLFVIWRWLPEPARGGQSAIAVGQEDVSGTGGAGQGGGGSGEQTQARDQARRAIPQSGARPREDLILDRDPTERSIWWAIGYLVRIPTYRLLIIASSLGYYFFAGIRGFGMIYLTEHYGVSRSTLSALVIVIGLGAFAGMVFSGRITRHMVDRGFIQARIVVPGVALLLAALFIAPAVWTGSVYIGVALLTVGASALAAAMPPIDAARLDIITPRMWGRAEAGRMVLRALLEGGSPILFGAVAGWLGGGESGLEYTYLIMLIPVVVASSLAIPAYFSYPRDVMTASASVERLRSR